MILTLFPLVVSKHSLDHGSSNFILSLQVKANAVRALGNLSRYVICTPLHRDGGVVLQPCSLRANSVGEISASDCRTNEKISTGSAASTDGSLLMGRMVQAILSCVTTGNVKVWTQIFHL